MGVRAHPRNFLGKGDGQIHPLLRAWRWPPPAFFGGAYCYFLYSNKPIYDGGYR